MPDFNYVARDKAGKKIQGQRDGASIEEVAAHLQSENLIPIEINPIHVTQKKTKSLSISIDLSKIFQKPVSPKAIQMFCRQLYTLLKVGIPIVASVTKLVETTRDPQLVAALRQVLIALNQGSSLSEGLARSPKVFSNFFVNLVAVGENSGQLDKIFLYLSDYVLLEVDMTSKMKAALRYPKMVGIGIIIAVTIINLFVIPAFSRLFASFHGTLPLPTRILIGTSQFFLDYWYFIFGLIALAVYGFRYAIKTETGMIRWGAIKLKIPIVGWITKRITLTRFTKLYAMVLRAGLTASQGIALVGESSSDPYFTYKIRKTADLVARGMSITAALTQTDYFPPLMLQMVALGEESGNIDSMLTDVGDFYQRELDYDLARLGESIEPILIVIAGGFVLLLALGVFLPMWDMASQMQQHH